MSAIVSFPYGKTHLTHDFEGENLLSVLTSSIQEYTPSLRGEALVCAAMENPINSPRLSQLAKGKKKVVLIASDHTRPVPSKIIVPPMLREIREAEPNAEITILIATGCHRYTTEEELIAKFGEEIVRNERIVVHDSDDESMLVHIGTLPSGGALRINRIAAEADLLVSEGFIEPHLFAGFSGGRKSVLPGIASKETVLANHCGEFIAHPCARTGILDGNPVHRDMLWAAKRAKLAYIVNVVIDESKEAIYAVAGDLEAAHAAGCAFLSGLCRVTPNDADIAITTNGGYPLDQNLYQAVKGMTAAEAAVREGGIVIMLSSASDGHGGEEFYRQLSRPDTAQTMRDFLSRGRNETIADQWQAQILLRILSKARVILISEAPREMIEQMHMIPASDIAEALSIAKELLGNDQPSITAIPNGISVMVVR